MEYEPTWRRNMSDICRDFYNLSKEYSNTNSCFPDVLTNDYFLSVDDAIKEHKFKDGNKQLAWQSFKHNSSTNIIGWDIIIIMKRNFPNYNKLIKKKESNCCRNI